MASIPNPTDQSLDIREQIARIDRMQAEISRVQAEISKWQVDITKTRADITKTEQDSRLAPFALAFTGVGAGAAIFAAGAAFAKLFVN